MSDVKNNVYNGDGDGDGVVGDGVDVEGVDGDGVGNGAGSRFSPRPAFVSVTARADNSCWC